MAKPLGIARSGLRVFFYLVVDFNVAHTDRYLERLNVVLGVQDSQAVVRYLMRPDAVIDRQERRDIKPHFRTGNLAVVIEPLPDGIGILEQLAKVLADIGVQFALG